MGKVAKSSGLAEGFGVSALSEYSCYALGVQYSRQLQLLLLIGRQWLYIGNLQQEELIMALHIRNFAVDSQTINFLGIC